MSKRPGNQLRSVGTLGSSATFAGEAATRIQVYEGLGEISYFKSIAELWSALDSGQVDAIVIGIERTGQPHEGRELVDSDYCVAGQLISPLACNLYVKPGTTKRDISKIVGHGSILQCEEYLDANFPGVPRELHSLNSVVAAQDVAAGDGSLAVVATQNVGRVVQGLQTYATRIDSGALSSWWLITRVPMLSERATTVIAKGRFGPDGQLGAFVSQLKGVQCTLTSIAGFPCNQGISTYDYLFSFSNPPAEMGSVERVVCGFSSAKIIGAFERRQEPQRH